MSSVHASTPVSIWLRFNTLAKVETATFFDDISMALRVRKF